MSRSWVHLRGTRDAVVSEARERFPGALWISSEQGTPPNRVRSLLGQSHEAVVIDLFDGLQLDVLGARDAAMVAEVAVGLERSRSQSLETELARAQRDFIWLREQVVVRAKSLRARTPRVGRVVGRLTGR